MREKKWTDCPTCGARGSMHRKKNQEERFNPPGYPPLDVLDLDGPFRESCGQGFWSLKSERRIARLWRTMARLASLPQSLPVFKRRPMPCM